VNGNGRSVIGDVVPYCNRMGWIGKDRPVADSDCNGNDRVAFADIVRLFNTL